MSMVVWKFLVWQKERPGEFEIEMPVRAKIVHFGQQNDTPTIWALVDPDEFEREIRRIFILPTGMASDRRLAYIGTTTLYGGEVVVHGFEIDPPSPPVTYAD